ncbi:formimidoylglutamate deiminase [Mangrovicella endophytica]|uniref:formimidoylglutamate deiminase n=1 Tax=Mangrovicella endophytica TaxID=2066697 RepID=UPI000C9E632E|nr:formimidoylglutamate deiminase [Mangrovicella endophytica]
MTAIHARSALLPGGWADDVRLEIEDGIVRSVTAGAAAEPADARAELLVPALPNLHSHAFQRAMAGLTETRGPGSDSFWSWRSVMYRFALGMDPDDVEAVAAQLYMEMLEAGFGRVGEFHYLHHDRDGSVYGNIAEMAERIGAAAEATGIALTLLPVFYARSGFGGGAPVEGQRRFINDAEAYARLVDGCRAVTARLPDAVLGIAPHSLRAATPEDLQAILPLAAGGPIHIHVAEQVKEVEDCLAWSGARPVEWLLDHAPVDTRWCLIHATHMTEDETRRMALSGAVAGLCPITEANLGDGAFPIDAFLESGGSYGVGSDSNVMITVPGELRQLEYSARIDRRARNVVAEPGGSTGRMLFDRAISGGAMALGASAGIAAGHSADLVSLDAGAVAYLPREAILDHWIFAGGIAVDGVWVRGRKQVEGGRHVNREAVDRRFRQTMTRLLARDPA